jgi:hypothetical protein
VDQASPMAAASGPSRPGGLLDLVTSGLAARGLDVRAPDGEADLVIGCHDARSFLWVAEPGHAEWDWFPPEGQAPDPKQVADMVTVLMSDGDPDLSRRGLGYGHPGITLKGVVGMELEARGLDVRLGIYQDDRHYDVEAEVVVTSRASRHAGTVYVTEDCALTWTRDYWVGDDTPEADSLEWIANPVQVADAIVASIVQAMSVACPVTAEEPR